MCYRVSTNFSHIDVGKIKEFKVSKVASEFEPRFNVAPSQRIPVIVPGSRVLDLYKWGLIPSWAKDSSIGDKLGNARSETIDEKPSFRGSFKNKRCLVLVSGFYEWDSSKQPYHMQLLNQKIFALAGLWDIWRHPESETIKSCTVITCEPNDIIGSIHNRMPVILKPEDYETWLTTENLEKAKKLLKPFDDKLMKGYEVSKQVNYYKNDFPELIKPVSKKKDPQQTLF